MSKKPKDPLAQYAEEVRSGKSGKFPETHPESKEMNGGKDIYPQPPPSDVNQGRQHEPAVQDKNGKRELYKQVVIAIIVLLALGSVGYYAYQKYKGNDIPTQREPLFGQVDEVSADYEAEQQLALDTVREELASRERIIMATIEKFFESSFRGRRKLCISFKSGETRCTDGFVDKQDFIDKLP